MSDQEPIDVDAVPTINLDDTPINLNDIPIDVDALPDYEDDFPFEIDAMPLSNINPFLEKKVKNIPQGIVLLLLTGPPPPPNRSPDNPSSFKVSR